MTNPRQTQGTRMIATLLAIGAIAISSAVQAYPAQQGAADDHWNMIYHAGAGPIPPESKIAVTLESGKMLLRAKNGREFAIPLNQITAVSSSVTGHYGRVSRAEAKFADSLAPNCGQMDIGCGAAVITAMLLVIPSYPIKTTDRLVRIVWRDKSLDEEVVLKLRKSDYSSFLAQIENGTAKPWKNVDAVWAKVKQELQDAASSKVEIRLDHKVSIAKSDLEPGTYQIVLLQREANRGELYFFPGNAVNTEQLAAVAPVEIAQPTNDENKLQVDYKQDINGNLKISNIQIPSKIFRFL
jgi:hypothetical protein